MRVPISYALHYPERADVDVPRLDLAAVGELAFEQPDPRRSPACGSPWRRARRAAARPACSTPPTRSRSTPSSPGGSRSPRSPPPSRASSPRCRPSPVTHFEELFAIDEEARRRTEERIGGFAARMNWVLIFLGFSALDHPPRGRALLRRQGDRDEGRALLPLLPAEARLDQTGRDRVRDRRDPRRRLRENHRDEPRRGAAARGGGAGLLPPAGLEADRRHRSGAGGQHRHRLGDPVLSLPQLRLDETNQKVGTIEPGSPAARRP